MNEPTKGKRSYLRQLMTTLFLIWAPMGIPFLGLGVGHAADFCKLTSKAALTACISEVKTDNSVAIGNCYNLTDTEGKTICKQEATEEAQEARNDCSDQFEARRDICLDLGPDPYDPEIVPENFVAVIDNVFLPMVPGTIMIYEGGDERIEVSVTNETKEILGVTCTVVRDTVYEDGEIVEDTYDWFAQDVDGNVWYFGELSMEFEEGEFIGLEGSWKAGEDGAKPGIVMLGNPLLDDVYRQEFLLTEAEDMGRVIDSDQSVEVEAGSYDGVLVTDDWTPIESDVLENKYYAPGVGMVMEVDLETDERIELVEVVNP